MKITQGDREKANSIAMTGLHVCCESDQKFINHVNIIAQALADQREEDAKIVETMGFEMNSFVKIATAIRQGKP